MTQAADPRISAQLRPGEKLLWFGRPQRGFLLHPFSILLIASIVFIVGLICGFIALNNMTHAIRVIEIVTAAARQRFTVTGMISGMGILLGLIAIWGFVFYPLQRRKTVYAMTDQRTMVMPGLSRKKTLSFELSCMNFTALTRRSGKKATVIFGEYPAEYAEMDAGQKRKVMNTWRWFGYKFDLFEVGYSSGSQSQASGRPRFGRFECIENSRDVYDMLRKAANIRQPEVVVVAEVEQERVPPFVERVVKNPGIITFVIDVSASMDGEKLDQAKRGLFGALDMAENNQVGLVSFDSVVRTRIPVERLANNRQELTAAVQNMNAAACTALYDALREAIEMTDLAEGSDADNRAVVVLTDGQANEGKVGLDSIIRLRSRQGNAVRYSGLSTYGAVTDAEGRRLSPADVVGCGLAMSTRHPVQIFFIGIGHDADMEIGRMLAEATSAESQRYVELPSGHKVERTRRVREVDIARVLEEFKYF